MGRSLFRLLALAFCVPITGCLTDADQSATNAGDGTQPATVAQRGPGEPKLSPTVNPPAEPKLMNAAGSEKGSEASGSGKTATVPYAVKLANQDIRVKPDGTLFFEKPVANDAMLWLGVKADVVIISCFKCDDKGKPSGKPLLLLLNKQNSTRLNRVMDHKTFSSGPYLMEVDAGGEKVKIYFRIH